MADRSHRFASVAMYARQARLLCICWHRLFPMLRTHVFSWIESPMQLYSNTKQSSPTRYFYVIQSLAYSSHHADTTRFTHDQTLMFPAAQASDLACTSWRLTMTTSQGLSVWLLSVFASSSISWCVEVRNSGCSVQQDRCLAGCLLLLATFLSFCLVAYIPACTAAFLRFCSIHVCMLACLHACLLA